MSARTDPAALPDAALRELDPTISADSDHLPDMATLIARLAAENRRLGGLLSRIDGGRWWTLDSPDRLSRDNLATHVVDIRRAVDAIEHEVGHLGVR